MIHSTLFLRQFCGRNHDMADLFGISMSQMTIGYMFNFRTQTILSYFQNIINHLLQHITEFYLPWTQHNVCHYHVATIVEQELFILLLLCLYIANVYCYDFGYWTIKISYLIQWIWVLLHVFCRRRVNQSKYI